MIVGRLAAAAKVIINEFSRTDILNLIAKAVQLAGQRPNMNAQQYRQEVETIRASAEDIVGSGRLITLPNDLRPMFFDGSYGNAIPERLAKTLLRGVTYDKVASMSSAELSFYQEAGDRLRSNLNNMLDAFKSLGVDDIEVPSGKVSLDFLVPRSAFENDALGFIKINSSFVEVISYIQELVTGDLKAPDLVYTSTSNPVIGYAVEIAALAPAFIFYGQILDVAKKQIDLFKVIKSWRDMFPKVELPPEANIDDKVKQLTRHGAESVVEQLTESGLVGVDDSRKAEITNAITMKSSTLITALANGARMSITLESQVTLEQDMAGRPLEVEQLKALLDGTRPLEQTVEESLKLLNQNVPLLEHIPEN